MQNKNKSKTTNILGWLLAILAGMCTIFSCGREGTIQDITSDITSESVEESYFRVHFIDVGQADAALVLCDDAYMLIDGGNSADSSLMYSYLKEQEITYLDYIVASHAHEDHVGGLAGAMNYADVGAVYCPVTSYDSEPFRDFVKYVEKQDLEITVPKVGDSFHLGSAVVEILGLNAEGEENDASMIVKISYGDTSFLFTGDAEREAEQALLNSGLDISSTVLKVGHHGAADSTTYPFLREVMPTYAIISVGADNGYGHPTEGTLSRLEDAGAQIYRTDVHGNVIATSDGQSVTITTEKSAGTLAENTGDNQKNAERDNEYTQADLEQNTGNSRTDAEQTDENEYVTEGSKYILNTNSKKYHIPSCPSVETIAKHNYAEYTGTAEEVEAMGYVGCKRCNPVQ